MGRSETIVNYFMLGFTAVEILGFLVSIHGFRLSLRQLRRILRNNGCTRREDPTSLRAGSQGELRACTDGIQFWISASRIGTRNSHWSDAIIYMFPLSSIYVNCGSTMHKKHIN